MSGRILDGDGAPVEHARLEIEALGSGTTYDLGTDSNGSFLLPQLAPGAYKVSVSAPGFAAWTLPDVEIRPGEQRNLNPRLASLVARRQDTADAAGRPVSARAHPPLHTPAIPSARTARAGAALARLQQQARDAKPEGQEPDVLALQHLAATSAETLALANPAPASMRSDNAPKVHAHVTVTTPQGLVEAEITEKPLVSAKQTDWSAFEPGRHRRNNTSIVTAAGTTAGHSEAASLHGRQNPTYPSGPSPANKPAGTVAYVSPAANEELQDTAEDLSGVPPVPPLNEHMAVHAAAEDAGPGSTPTQSAKSAGRSAPLQLADAFSPQADAEREVPSEENASDTVTLRKNVTEDDTNSELDTEDAVLRGHAQEDAAGPSDGERGDSRSLTIRSWQKARRMHGQVFVEDRDAAWGAENAYTTLTTETAAGAFVTTPYKPPDRRLQAGLELGGPLGQEGRGHWFLAVDGLQRNNQGMAVVSEPSKFFAPLTAEQFQTLQGRLQAGMSTALNSAAAQALYTQAMGELDGLLGSVPRSTRQLIASPRFDWRVNARNRISLGYDMIRLDAVNGVQSSPTETWGTHSFGTRTLRLDSASARLNSFLSENLLNQLSYTAAYDLQSEMPLSPGAFEQTLAHNPLGMPPQVSVAGGSGGFRFGTPSYLDKTAYPAEFRQTATDTLTWMRGLNQMSIGYALDYVRDRISGLNYGAGGYTYSTREAFIADLLSPNHCDASTTGTGNLPCWSRYQQTVGPDTFIFDTADYAGFVTDTYKLLRSLTLSAGARYSFEHLPRPQTSLVNPEIPQTAVLPSEGSLGPRVGFAWALPWQGHDREAATIVRGGFGIFFGRISNAAVLSAISQTGTASAQRNYLFKPLDTGAPQFPVVFSAHPDLQIAPDVTYFAAGYRHPRAIQTQLSVEQSLGRSTTLTLSYWGSFANQLPQIVDENIDLNAVGRITYAVDDPKGVGPLKGPYASKFFYKRLNPSYNQMAEMQSTAKARYQAAGASLLRRLPNGMLLKLSYVNAHALDDDPYAVAYNGRWNVLDPSNLALDWGTSNEDIRSRLTGGVVLHEPWHASGWMEELFGGYTLDLTGGYRSGRPYTMRTVGTVPSFACSYQGWLAAGEDCVLSSPSGVITGVPVPIEGLGDSLNGSGGANWLAAVGRNTYRYPAAFNADLRFAKRTAIGSRKALEFGADISNFMNHSNVTHLETAGYVVSGETASTGAGRLTYLSGANGHAQFGAVTTTNNDSTYRDRQIELVLRLIF